MGSYTGTVPSFLAGELASATKLLEVSNFMTAITAADTAYTPTWTASAGAVAINNGTLTGGYTLIGKTVDFQLTLTAGGLTTFGTAGAYWILGLPPVGVAAANYQFAVRALDSGVLEYAGFAYLAAGGATVELFKPVSGRIVNNSPFTFGSGDVLTINGRYKIA
jgi:hypothetical protein